MVKTPCFQCRSLIPGRGTKILQASGCGQKKKKKKKKKEIWIMSTGKKEQKISTL